MTSTFESVNSTFEINCIPYYGIHGRYLWSIVYVFLLILSSTVREKDGPIPWLVLCLFQLLVAL